MRNYIALFSSGTQLTAQFPSHGLGEPVAYGFQTVAKGAPHYSVVINMKIKHGGDVNEAILNFSDETSNHFLLLLIFLEIFI